MELIVKLKKEFGNFKLDFDFTARNSNIGIFGPSGSGKSSLLSMIAGLHQPDEGHIFFNDEPLYNDKINIPPDKRKIGIIFQNPHLFPHLSVKGNLLFGLKRCSRENRKIDFHDLIDVLQLSHLLDRGVNKLSGGEKQRVAIGRAVLSNPRLLLMDEPLTALDDSLRFQIINHLKNVCSAFHIPYLFVSHSLLEMRLMAEQVLNIEAGRITGQYTSEELARRNLGASHIGFINIIKLGKPLNEGGVFAYPWGKSRLYLSEKSRNGNSFAELSSKDIMLFKKHPEATSARNLLPCTVKSIFTSDGKTGVELDCSGNILVAEIVHDAVAELKIKKGSNIYAAIKASAFRLLPA